MMVSLSEIYVVPVVKDEVIVMVNLWREDDLHSHQQIRLYLSIASHSISEYHVTFCVCVCGGDVCVCGEGGGGGEDGRLIIMPAS